MGGGAESGTLVPPCLSQAYFHSFTHLRHRDLASLSQENFLFFRGVRVKPVLGQPALQDILSLWSQTVSTSLAVAVRRPQPDRCLGAHLSHHRQFLVRLQGRADDERVVLLRVRQRCFLENPGYITPVTISISCGDWQY